ncbi:bifunctional riboflavin kinase/FAD synthetase [Xanthobacteraceae bacterium Astr-EGSB]|uniref:bifunctional riboflavin kinase/FAD synthetase n=1 Tax=Astrobacterium formosum TaxID=3069710 RepID=UPI0027AE3BB1|nr:bifunctional riboflavin kinase/FAD synthetase [Xanthobacteraceae bacterium Astr-EGSB]
MTDHSTLSTSVLPTPFTVVRGGIGSSAVRAERLRGAVVAIGNFEGVHRGHQSVIALAQTRARALGRPAAVLTFAPHPRTFFNPTAPAFRLGDVDTKLRLLSATGLDGAVVLDFDASLAGLDPAGFVERVLMERLAVGGVVVGYDFQFGKGRGGTTDVLRAAGASRGFTVDVAEAFVDGGRRISSGLVRAALAAGDIAEATDLLGRPWFVTGEVVHGDKRGRELGFPTANLRLDPEVPLRYGVYAVRVSIDGRLHDGVANFGRRPMFDTGAVLLEAFVFDFSGDIYGATIDVSFTDWIRPEMTFGSIDELVRRMGEDSRRARTLLGRTPPVAPPPRLGEARPLVTP